MGVKLYFKPTQTWPILTKNLENWIKKLEGKPLPWNIEFKYHEVIKFGFSEKATKFEKNLLRTFDKSVVFCAHNSVLVKKSTKIFQNKCGQVVLYKLQTLLDHTLNLGRKHCVRQTQLSNSHCHLSFNRSNWKTYGVLKSF